MRSRFWFYFVLAVCVVFAVLALWMRPIPRKSNAAPKSPVVQAPAPSTNIKAASQTIHVSNHGNSVSGGSKSPSVVQTNLQSPGERRVEMLQQALERKDVPVVFYGQVIDQDSNALPGVEIRVYIRHWKLTKNALTAPVYLTEETGNGGRFEVSGETGDALGIESIRKGGYEAEPGPRSFGAVSGSFENPVIFKMWNNSIHAKLITGNKAFPIVPDGRPYVIDLTKDTIAESGAGDLKVWVRRPAQITYGQRYDWSCGVDVINGGLLQETDASASMYEAPVGGYTPSFGYGEKAGVNGWSDSMGAKRFYIRLNDGPEYGRISIKLEAYYNGQIPGMVRLSYAINPSGSRILK